MVRELSGRGNVCEGEMSMSYSHQYIAIQSHVVLATSYIINDVITIITIRSMSAGDVVVFKIDL